MITAYDQQLIDLVAQAIYSDSYTQYNTCSDAHWRKTSETQREFCRGQAVAALQAMERYRQSKITPITP